MTTLTPIFTSSSESCNFLQTGPACMLYERLLQPQLADGALDEARSFLDTQLEEAAGLPCDMPAQPEALLDWMRNAALSTTQAYALYLEERRQGAPRRYFANRAHALYFLRHVAPTKLVDGAWLYGLLKHWQELRLRPLLRTYLEELGDGVPAMNHVVLYKQLLAQHGCDELAELEDAHFLQGAQQLALGHLADDYLPEVIGYNLGYEQLPLHLLISSYELTELDIDPYYFQLHVTIDNASTGHAQKAVQAVWENMPLVGDRDAFYRRVINGYRLNDLGLGSTSVIAAFDLEEEVCAMLERKRDVATQVHSDYCRIEGRTVNEWLSQPGQVRSFLDALQKRGWIRRDEDPQSSRFWQLVQGDRAAMFGVFNAYEQQLLHDWIAGDWTPPRARGRSRRRPAPAAEQAGGLDDDMQALHATLRALPAKQQPAKLIELMSPASHFTPAGLLATRLFNAYLQ
ncbi:iron-containing redox enzyme family protein [Pseudomonas seleniipraecipitans]|uniref:Iron-containing redox enzyme family protein n=1 Tax=Phytopseudomonas seleniipraecipitans TaxID=640205 RepID=A0ABY5JB81_9GAMM|nr:iron-containing redox enzyme family protein [Pseudomonas seleniipraecipitans]UUD65311.1 iron-containing redox enzyme family protein [Pseudomonas seleniipraecipitans]